MLLKYRQCSPVVKLMPSGASSKDHDLFKTSTWWSELLRRLQESSSAYGYHLSIQPLFVNRLLVPAMNFPAPLQILRCGKRLNSCSRVFKDLFQSGETYRPPVWSVDKHGVYNAINKTLEARDSWQGKRFVGRTSDTSTSRVFDHQQGASL
jgi:hypothetical protein